MVCTYRLVMISIDLSEIAQKSALQIRDKIKDIFFRQLFFLTFFTLTKDLFLLLDCFDCGEYGAKCTFCLGLDFVSN